MLIDLKFSGNSYYPVSMTNTVNAWSQTGLENNPQMKRKLGVTCHWHTPPTCIHLQLGLFDFQGWKKAPVNNYYQETMVI